MNTATFRAARDLLLLHRTDLDKAVEEFRWPEFTEFNWALDWFDAIAGGRPALRIVGKGGLSTDRAFSFEDLSVRSDQVAVWLRSLGVRRGDPLLLMLGNREPLWETMLAAIKLGAVVVPTYTTATAAELADRLDRGGVRYVVAESALAGRFVDLMTTGCQGVAVGGPVPGWASYEDSFLASRDFTADGPTPADSLLFRYFTSGTTSRPKMVEHTHVSYPVGHLSGMYWNGVRPGDVHLNIAAPGWAKHAWSSFFVPWNAEAEVLAMEPGSPSPSPDRILDVLRTRGVTGFCAPPTVWRGLAARGLGERPAALREVTAAGEPLEPALLHAVRDAWDLDLRDGYGQTETTAQIGNPPGRRPVPGGTGHPLPGIPVLLLDPESGREVPDGEPGEICLDLSRRPAGMMRGYTGDPGRTLRAFAGDCYRTGDLAVRSADGLLTYLSRADDMFKSFDHRISPGELERALLGHPAVADAAVVPVADPVGMWLPKAYVVAAPGHAAYGGTARRILEFSRSVLPPEKWVGLLEFTAALPRTTSGKVRRGELKEVRRGTEYAIDGAV